MAQDPNSQQLLLDLQIQISVLNMVATALVSHSPDRNELVSAIRLLAEQVKANTVWPSDSGIEARIDTYLSSIIG
jgi:hypothetical protein